MKPVRRSLCLLLALMLVFATATTAFATQEGTLTGGSITIENAVVGQTYNAYQILYLESYNATSGAYAYKANSAWETWLKTQTTFVSFDDQGYVTWVEGAEAAAFAKAAQAQAQTAKMTADATATATAAKDGATTATVKFENLKLGYYLVDTTLGTLCSLDTTNPSVTMEEKNEVPTSTKTVEEDSTKQYGAKNDADIGQTVNFKATITAQPGAENYVFHDKMSAGLTFAGIDKVTVKVGDTALTQDTDYTISAGTEKENPCTFEIAFEQDYLDKITSETTITIEYTATLNENAVVGSTGNPNDIWLDYGDANNTKTTPKSETVTYTWEFKVFKFAKGANNTENPLAGATFTLSKKSDGTEPIQLISKGNNVYRVAKENETGSVTEITTGATGTFTIQGLDADTYYLTETKAPDGYNKLAASIKVTIDSNGNVKKDSDTSAPADKTVKVENKSGTELPSTGGMGTTIFYVLGSVLVLAAVVLLVTRRRMRREG